MTLYIFSALKTLRDIVPPAGLTGLVHDESAYTVSATIPMDLTVVPGEHIGFMCVDGRFRMFTVTKAENKDFDATTIITGIDTAVQELKETIVPELQQLEVNLHDAVVALLDASDARSSWSVTGSGPADLKKHRAYYTSMWTMLETLAQLYEWRIIPHYYFASGAITGRTIELAADTATFRGRILQSKKDASNVYVIKSTPPITRLYGLGPSKSQEPGVSENLTFAEAEWSTAAGDPANKPKEQTYVDDPAAVAKYGVRSSTVQFDEVEDEKDLLQKTWNHLQTIKEPTCTVEATVQDLEQVPGYETKIIRLGDLVPVRLSNAAMEEARVIGIKRDYVKPWLTKVTIGDKTASLSTQVTSLMTNALHTHETLTIYKNRFHEDEALIQLNAQFVQANAERIELNAQLIGLYATYTDELTGRITAAEIELDGMKATIDLWAGTLDEFGRRLDGAELLIDGLNHKITASVEDLDGKIAALELSLTDLEAKVVLKAEYDEDKNAMLTLISSNEESIATLAAQHGDRLAALELYTSDLESRVLLKAEYEENREADLQLISNAQESVATLETKYDDQIASLTLRADEQGSLISAKADRIELEGYVSMDDFEALEGKVADLEAGLGTVTVLNANTVNATDVNATFVGTSSLTFAGSTVSKRSITMGSISTAGTALSAGGALDLSHSHAVSVGGDGTITLGEVSSTGGSFKIADTKYYKDGVSAARTEGANSVTLTVSGWQSGGRNTVTASNGQSKTISLPSFSASGGTSWNASNQTTVYFYTGSVSGPLASKTVDASSVYEDGADSVTMSAGEWASNKMTVTASNGKTLEVDASSIYQSGAEFGMDYGYKFAIQNARLTLEGTIVTCEDASGNYTGPTLDISSNLDAAYDDGYADATPTGVDRTATYNSADNTYSLSIKVKSADGSSRDFTAVALNAAAAYDAGYKAAVDSATFSVDGTNVVVTFSDGTTKTLDAKQYVTVSADVQYVSSTATTMTVRGWGYAYFNDVYCVGASRSQTYDTAD